MDKSTWYLCLARIANRAQTAALPISFQQKQGFGERKFVLNPLASNSPFEPQMPARASKERSLKPEILVNLINLERPVSRFYRLIRGSAWVEFVQNLLAGLVWFASCISRAAGEADKSARFCIKSGLGTAKSTPKQMRPPCLNLQIKGWPWLEQVRLFKTW